MSIIQISRIQHRRGLDENLPQLSSAELGWAIDSRRLFIGNGTLEEGAPTLGNTEILTEHSNLLELMSDAYIYRQGELTYPVDTGLTPVARSLQSRFDDYVSVAAFGATGDGTDQTAQIDRALSELYRRYVANPKSRAILYFPAGIYGYGYEHPASVGHSGTLNIPAFATLVGDGKDNTIIRRTLRAIPNSNPFVAVTELPNLQTTGTQVPATNIQVSGITFDAGLTEPSGIDDNDVLVINSAVDVVFSDCQFIGNADLPSSPTSSAVVRLTSPNITKTERVLFYNCDLVGASYGVIADHDMNQITFQSGSFRNLHKGVKLGEATAPSTSGPRGFRFINNEFDDIANHGIHTYRATRIVSSFNYFKNVGKGITGINPLTPVITMGDYGLTEPTEFSGDLSEFSYNISIGDQFDRTDTEALIYPKTVINGTGSYSLNDDQIVYGSLITEVGRSVKLIDGTPVPTSTGIVLPLTRYREATIDYAITRGIEERSGTLRIVQSSYGQTLDEEYSESYGDLGVEFQLSFSSGVSTVIYTTASTGNDAILRYSIRHFLPATESSSHCGGDGDDWDDWDDWDNW